LQKEHHLLLANFTKLANALTINPLLDQLPTTLTYQLPFVSETTKQDHTAFFSKLVKQTNHSMPIFVWGYAA